MDPFPSKQYPSCLLEGGLNSSRLPFPRFMTASSPVPFSEISGELSIPHIIPELEEEEEGPSQRSQKRTGRAKGRKEEGTGKFKCRTCKRRFQTKGGLNIHLREHQPEIFLIKCPDCPFSCYQKSNFAKHAAIKHHKDTSGAPISEPLSCPTCEFKCFTEEQLKLHVARKHDDGDKEKQFKCSECNYSTIEKAALSKHFKIVHEGKRDFECSVCGFRSQTSSGLARHRRSHLELKPHQCPLCPLSYADKKRLRDHLLKHSDIKQFSCSNCKYRTNRKDNLNLHFKRNHMPP